jgi:hypothetical protein
VGKLKYLRTTTIKSAFTTKLKSENDFCRSVQKVLSSNQITPWYRVLLDRLIVCSASEEILRLLWNKEVYYLVHKTRQRSLS